MHTKLGKYSIQYFNEEEYHSLKREIFSNDCYFFETEKENPNILDIGSYIGMSILYFKKIYPKSHITSFEPNPKAFTVLKNNLFENGIDDVEIHNYAIWTESGTKKMYIDNTGMDRYSVGSFIPNGWNNQVKSNIIEVNTQTLDKYITDEIDLLKLDVEGSEQKIIKNISKYFNKIKNIILEYHPTKDQSVKKILDILSGQYKVTVYEEGKLLQSKYPNNKLLTIKAIYR